MRDFRLMLMALLFVPCSNAQITEARRTVALTFDDLPAAFSRFLAAMKRNTPALLRTLNLHRAPAIGFVNEEKLHVPGEIDASLGTHRFQRAVFWHSPNPG